MPLYLRARMLGAVGLLTAGACALLGTPAAHASSSSGAIEVYGINTTIGLSGPGRDIPISLVTDATPSPAYANATVSIDTSQLTGIATVTTTQAGCTTAGTKITCDLGSMTTSGLSMTVHAAAAPGVKAGAKGQLLLTAWADGVAPTTEQSPTTVAVGDGPELRFFQPVDVPNPLSLGQIYTAPQYTFENYGSQNAEGVTIVFKVPYEAPFVNLASNCQYAADANDGGKPTHAACYFPNIVQPGESDVIATPPQVQIRKDTIAGYFGYVEDQAEPGYRPGSAVDGSLTWFNGTGPALTIRPTSGSQANTPTETAQTDIDPLGESVSTGFQVPNGASADLTAIGATATAGAKGSSVTVTVGVHNNGPGAIDFGSWATGADDLIFTAPSGTTVSATNGIVPGCVSITDGVKYDCRPSRGSLLMAGQSRTYTFTLLIRGSGSHTDGTVTVDHGPASGFAPAGPDDYDTDWSNDTAHVVLNGGSAAAVPLVALTSDKSSVWAWSGSGTSWIRIGGRASHVYAGAAGVFATSPGDGAIYRYNGTPGSWTQIGRAGAQFGEGGGNLYALTPNKSGVWQWTGNGSTWTQIGGGAANLYAGNDGLFATSPTNGDIFQYLGTGTTWNLVSLPAASAAVSGPSVFTLSTDKSTITQIAQMEPQKVEVGGPASAIYAGGLGLFSTEPITGDLYENVGTTFTFGNSWVKVGGPGSEFSVGDSAMYGLTTSKNGVWKWSGSGSTWTRIGGPAAQIAAGD